VAVADRTSVGEGAFPCRNADHNDVNLRIRVNNDCKIGAETLRMPAICDILGV
jgi:hypothetical protein